MMDDIKAFFLRLYGYWVVSGLILLGLSLLWIWLTGGLVEILTELIMSLVLESFVFPSSLLVTWLINPLQLLFHFIIFITLLLLKYLLESRR